MPTDLRTRATPNVRRPRLEAVHTEGFDASDYERPPKPQGQPTYLVRLPMPPSNNELVRPAVLGRSAKGRPIARLVKTKTAGDWRKVALERLAYCVNRPIDGPVYVCATFYVARVNGDLDNRLKALFDALTRAGAWRDDKQVVRIEAEKALCSVAEAPWCEVRVGGYWVADPLLRARLTRTSATEGGR